MCGIVGYVGRRPCQDLLIESLAQLEYRGYDSAGIALVERGNIERARAKGNLTALRAVATDMRRGEATTGVGHTRWATHGKVTESNAHPHMDENGTLAVVMNGIIENYATLRAELQGQGVRFSSHTDAEVIPHLIARAYHGDLVAAVRTATTRLSGHYAIVVAHRDHPHLLVGARQECPLVVGEGEGECFIASALPAFLDTTRHTIVIESGDLVALTPDKTTVYCGADVVMRERLYVDWDHEAAEKGGYDTFMLKEIHEQPGALHDTIGDRLEADGRVRLDDIGLDAAALARVERISIVACGTSYHAALAGRYLIEAWSGIPVLVDVASEARYRACLVGPGDIVIGITQSGETADTIAAMRIARERGAHVVALTNIMGSYAAREADGVIYTRAGLEVGVAATKTHTAQVMALALLGLHLGTLRHTLSGAGAADIADELHRIPDALAAYLASNHAAAAIDAGTAHAHASMFMFLGRHIGMPVALEGALKLKEISYAPADAYSAGEMKHGPIALIDEGMPVVVVAPDSHVFEKTVSNIEEVRARGAHVIAVASEGNEHIAAHADRVLWVPRTIPILSALTTVVPLQLFAYGAATARGLNVDQPRNLAKTVTVE